MTQLKCSCENWQHRPLIINTYRAPESKIIRTILNFKKVYALFFRSTQYSASSYLMLFDKAKVCIYFQYFIFQNYPNMSIQLRPGESVACRAKAIMTTPKLIKISQNKKILHRIVINYF